MIRYTLRRMICRALVALLFFCSCKKENLSATQEPVVEAYLMPGTALTVKLYEQKSLTDTAGYGPALSGLKLSVSNGVTTATLTETAAGVYTYADTSFLAAGKTYTLSFTYNTVTISARTIMPAKPQGFTTQHINVYYTPPTTPGTPDTLNMFTWQNPDSLNHVLVFEGLDGKSFPLNTFGGGGSVNFEVNTNRKSVYYALPQIFSYYSHYHVILLSVNQEYINLLQSNAESANSQSLLNIPTNVVNGLGIFTAMQADTLSFNLL